MGGNVSSALIKVEFDRYTTSRVAGQFSTGYFMLSWQVSFFSVSNISILSGILPKLSKNVSFSFCHRKITSVPSSFGFFLMQREKCLRIIMVCKGGLKNIILGQWRLLASCFFFLLQFYYVYVSLWWCLVAWRWQFCSTIPMKMSALILEYTLRKRKVVCFSKKHDILKSTPRKKGEKTNATWIWP